MEMLTPATVRALLTENGIRPKKSLGQHFLADPNTARRVATLAEVQPGDQVLEIGPGLGSRFLAARDESSVCAVELDASLACWAREFSAAVEGRSRARSCASVTPYTIDLCRALRALRVVIRSPTFKSIK